MTANENLEAISVSDTVPDLAVFFFYCSFDNVLHCLHWTVCLSERLVVVTRLTDFLKGIFTPL